MKADRSVIDQSLFSLSWPIFIDIFLHFSTLLINTYMIGHESISMVAATAIGNQFFDIFIPIFNFIGIGCSVVVAQHLGAKNYQQARHGTSQQRYNWFKRGFDSGNIKNCDTFAD